jgi:hypothetical protein
MHVIFWVHMFEHKMENTFINGFVNILIIKWQIYV